MNYTLFRLRVLFCLAIMLLIAGAVRLHLITKYPYVLDEGWSVETATGQGSLHIHLPLDRVINPPPQFYSRIDAPWWHIWTHMDVTHPPLYPLLLRLWEYAAGDSDYLSRLFSVVAALVSVILLFDIVRLHSGYTMATWAALLLALATPQIIHAQLARYYTMEMAVALVPVDIVVRIQLLGCSKRRLIQLTLALVAALLTHYFCIGPLLGLLVYCCIHLPDHRRKIIAAFITAGLIFAISWGPWMWQQRRLFDLEDAGINFLQEKTANHNQLTLTRLLMAPLRLLFDQPDTGVAGILAMIGGLALSTIPFLPILRRKQPFLMMWALWMLGIFAVLALLDLTRGSRHLLYIRYTLIAGPAVYALVPMLLLEIIRWKPIAYLAAALVVIGCAAHVPDVYDHHQVDLREPAHDLIRSPGPDDLLIAASPPDQTTRGVSQLFLLARYLPPLRCPVVVLTRTAGPDVIAAARRSKLIFINTMSDDLQTYLPGAHIIRTRGYPGLGTFWTVEMKK